MQNEGATRPESVSEGRFNHLGSRWRGTEGIELRCQSLEKALSDIDAFFIAQLYCQNLCLFGKLFIDHKYVFFETSGFLFYVLTEARPSFDHTFGFFSKEKISYNDYNLACIVTFPPFQKRGYGTLMIEFSQPCYRSLAQSGRS